MAETITLDDDFNGHAPLKGAEHLGRAITDRYGFPSGSPANYETLRAAALAAEEHERALEAGPSDADVAATLAELENL